MTFGVVVFPGSNCDSDVFHAIRDGIGQGVRYLWHRDGDLGGVDCVVLPGGFSYGDYLRPGAIARFSAVMDAVTAFAARGGLVLGICNGFQVLCEAGLLPGALLRNRSLRFVCGPAFVRVENACTRFTRACRPGQVLAMPVAHGDGRFHADPDTITGMEAAGQILMRYCGPDGTMDERFSPNGSAGMIAAVCNRAGNVAGMMPHPERAADSAIGGLDGLKILESMLR